MTILLGFFLILLGGCFDGRDADSGDTHVGGSANPATGPRFSGGLEEASEEQANETQNPGNASKAAKYVARDVVTYEWNLTAEAKAGRFLAFVVEVETETTYEFEQIEYMEGGNRLSRCLAAEMGDAFWMRMAGVLGGPFAVARSQDGGNPIVEQGMYPHSSGPHAFTVKGHIGTGSHFLLLGGADEPHDFERSVSFRLEMEDPFSIRYLGTGAIHCLSDYTQFDQGTWTQTPAVVHGSDLFSSFDIQHGANAWWVAYAEVKADAALLGPNGRMQEGSAWLDAGRYDLAVEEILGSSATSVAFVAPDVQAELVDDLIWWPPWQT